MTSSFYIKIIIGLLVVLFCFSFMVVECVRGAELGWDGMPVKEKKQSDGRLTKDWHFITATLTAFAFTAGDIEYTLHNINSHGAREGNHWASSFLDEGKRGKAYAYGFGVTGATMAVSYLFFKSKNPDTQKLWVIFPAICITGHSVGIVANIAF